MPRLTRLSDTEIAALMPFAPRWALADAKLSQDFVFKDFRAAWAFMGKVAKLAEQANHHPEWKNVYNRVEILLWTHEVGGLTALDFQLAAGIQGLLDNGAPGQVRFRNTSQNPDPRPETEHAAGLDLRADLPPNAPLVLEPRQRVLVPTGLFLEIPPGFEGQVRPRSGLALRQGVTVLNAPGTIDADYRGEVKVLLINHGNEPLRIHNGDRIAQLVLAKVAHFTLENASLLSETARGAGGFGHTGQ